MKVLKILLNNTEFFQIEFTNEVKTGKMLSN